jgi:hypothetical protein
LCGSNDFIDGTGVHGFADDGSFPATGADPVGKLDPAPHALLPALRAYHWVLFLIEQTDLKASGTKVVFPITGPFAKDPIGDFRAEVLLNDDIF